MQTLVLGLGKGKDKEFSIISNVIDRGYERYKKDDIPLVITLGDENSPIDDSTVNEVKAMEIESPTNINNGFNNIDTNKKLGSDTFVISDAFLDLKDIDDMFNSFSINREKKEKLAKEVYGADLQFEQK